MVALSRKQISSLRRGMLDYLWNVAESVQGQSAQAATSSFELRRSQRKKSVSTFWAGYQSLA